MQGLGSQIGHDDLVGALHEPVRHRLANLDAGDALDRGRDALDVLHVHGGEHVDVGGKDIENIFVALAVFAAFDIGMRKFVDENDLRTASEDSFEIHLLEDDASVFDLSSGEPAPAGRQARRCAGVRGFRRHR